MPCGQLRSAWKPADASVLQTAAGVPRPADGALRRVAATPAAEARCPKLFLWLCRLILVLTGKRKGGDPCVYVPERIINRPDPCLYSQFLLMQLGLPVTWDNPDVRIYLGGVEQNSYDLRVDTEYEVQVVVHNSSRRKPAMGTRVEVRWIEFGAGSQIRHAVATLGADVPTWPGTSTVSTLWRTPSTPGHYCLEVELAHPDDGNPANNRGWNNTQVLQAASEVRTPVRIFNRWPGGCPPVREGGDAISWWRVLLGYALLGLAFAAPVAGIYLRDERWLVRAALLPVGYAVGLLVGLSAESVRAAVRNQRIRGRKGRERRPCELVEVTVDSYAFDDRTGKDADPNVMFAGKGPTWPATVKPHRFMFMTGEVFRDVELTVQAPDEPGLPAVFNVSARQGEVALGGITVTVQRKQGA